jgi:hypothetical protein
VRGRAVASTVLAAPMGHESSTITERRYIHLFDRQFATLMFAAGGRGSAHRFSRHDSASGR